MAHEIAIINGKESMAYQGATPWHRLGVQMDGLPDVIAALGTANLNWNVALESMFTKSGTEVPNRKAVVRDVDNEILGVVGGDYHVLQNSEAFGVLQPACEKFGVTIETAGALGRGERVWMLAKLPESIEPIPGDRIDGYFLVTTSHNGALPFACRLTPIRVVCSNTLATAEALGESLVQLFHKASQMQHLDLVEELITSLVYALKVSGESFAELAAKNWSRAEVEAYIDKVLGIAKDSSEVESVIQQVLGIESKVATSAALKKRDTVLDLVWNGMGSKMAGVTKNGATAWAAYNAVVEYVDHTRPGEFKTPGGYEQANKSALFGSASRMKEKALALAIAA